MRLSREDISVFQSKEACDTELSIILDCSGCPIPWKVAGRELIISSLRDRMDQGLDSEMNFTLSSNQWLYVLSKAVKLCEALATFKNLSLSLKSYIIRIICNYVSNCRKIIYIIFCYFKLVFSFKCELICEFWNPLSSFTISIE